jgi:hypothetical protein
MTNGRECFSVIELRLSGQLKSLIHLSGKGKSVLSNLAEAAEMQASASSDKMRGQDMNTLYNRQHLLFATIMFACAAVTFAQSGRRSSGGTATTTTPSVSGPKTVEKKPDKPPRLQLLVGIDNRDPISNIPYYVSDTVIDNCVRHLGDASDVIVTSAGRGMNRSDAIKRAKEETVRYVVWLQIGSELADSGKQPSKNSVDELYVTYTILEPETAKFKQSGRSHHGIYQTGRGGVSTPTSSRNSPLYSEYALKQAALETAERVLAAFDIKLRDGR